MNEEIFNLDDLYKMLDNLYTSPDAPALSASWWDQFYQTRDKEIPFFTEFPDENLATYFLDGMLNPGKTLEVGCGNGRNTAFMASQGCSVDAIDYSLEAINWAKEKTKEKKLDINFKWDSIFNIDITSNSYDIIYDSGCLHHLFPHRRIQYIQIIEKALKPGGYLGLSCFAPGHRSNGGGAEMTDWDIYRLKRTRGGIAFTKEKLLRLFSQSFDLIEFRSMRECDANEQLYGREFLWTTLWQKR
ncbi:class I SAM-dependent methyltransferase [Bacillus mycoides]|uniref:Methyltransferase domain-containing protein n=1 Tax=Bacillus mycoides TaxID=1405 RepID=A0ABC9QUV3_BACMY|nr:class I SAM-dependent methyltransferase [Bacillus mycoides]EJR29906.1 hypothetical protein III_05675 [Bacillus mycoides]